jgi:serpin B
MGSEGLTEHEIQKALYLSLAKNKLPDAYRKSLQLLLEPYQIKDKKCLYFGTSIWTDKRFTPLPVYRYLIQKNFFGSLETFDSKNSSQSIELINTWMNNQTDHKASFPLKESEFSPAFQMLLISCGYIKSPWKSPFSKDLTYLEKFYHSENLLSTTHLPMMHQTLTCDYYENDALQVVSLPIHTNSHLSVIFVISKDLTLNFSEKDLTNFLQNKGQTDVEVTIPLTQFELRFNVKKFLMQRGMIKPFSAQANFSLITGKNEIHLSEVFHESYFSLQEEGIDTPHSLGASLNLKSIMLKPDKVFKANRPFLFFVFDNDQEYILFMGRYKTPIDS